MSRTTWRKLVTNRMKFEDESWEDVESTFGDLDTEFYHGYGGDCMISFAVCTPTNVYFPMEYDGLDLVGCVPRNPKEPIKCQ